MSSAGIFHFSIGQLRCTSILDKTDKDGKVADITPSVSEQEWDRVVREHGYSPSGMLASYFNNCFVRTGECNLLVDAGIGQWIFPGGSALVERLAGEGISPSQVDLVVITHTDGDHVGGLLTASGELQFPNASYILPKSIAEYWCDPEILAGLADDAVFSRKILPAIQDRLQIVPEGEEFLPGFRLHNSPGHRAGHSVLEITSDGETLLHLADAIGHPLLLEVPAWEWAYDDRPDQAMQDKQELLALAIDRDALVFAAHMPFPGLGHVIQRGEGWRWIPYDLEAGW
jgi:glyoxylase-like metal-dependent hydrolase (beta-lactamase superfamily II)